MRRSSSLAAIADKVSWIIAVALVSLLLVAGMRRGIGCYEEEEAAAEDTAAAAMRRGKVQVMCEEIYVVGEGETLHTISDKCGDPFIVEENPHIHDPDDVFPGLVIKITPHSDSSRFITNNY
ncbi:uncharacterized protein LOC124928687 [Impatiens glandulifera]|uniref:uncharacterized protein LOC124928687 n=1 Tax=Impatiens glandulifera TaxID=253017 RepID=UPI001FB1A152|nr:uncharacterized protein LOC124928687 [Impatiens glandulifera]